MVGDREYDILGARRNRVKSIAVTYGYGTEQELEQAQANQEITQFSELLEFFPTRISAV